MMRAILPLIAIFSAVSLGGCSSGDKGDVNYTCNCNATVPDPDGSPTPRALVLLNQAKRNAVVELVLFLAIFTCMILMRFGL